MYRLRISGMAKENVSAAFLRDKFFFCLFSFTQADKYIVLLISTNYSIHNISTLRDSFFLQLYKSLLMIIMLSRYFCIYFALFSFSVQFWSSLLVQAHAWHLYPHNSVKTVTLILELLKPVVWPGIAAGLRGKPQASLGVLRRLTRVLQCLTPNELTAIQRQGPTKRPVLSGDVTGVLLRIALLHFVSITPKKKLLAQRQFPFRNASTAIRSQELPEKSVKLKAVSGVLQPLLMFPGASTQRMVHMATL